jgi:hypothetical protein
VTASRRAVIVSSPLATEQFAAWFHSSCLLPLLPRPSSASAPDWSVQRSLSSDAPSNSSLNCICQPSFWPTGSGGPSPSRGAVPVAGGGPSPVRPTATPSGRSSPARRTATVMATTNRTTTAAAASQIFALLAKTRRAGRIRGFIINVLYR